MGRGLSPACRPLLSEMLGGYRWGAAAGDENQRRQEQAHDQGDRGVADPEPRLQPAKQRREGLKDRAEGEVCRQQRHICSAPLPALTDAPCTRRLGQSATSSGPLAGMEAPASPGVPPYAHRRAGLVIGNSPHASSAVGLVPLWSGSSWLDLSPARRWPITKAAPRFTNEVEHRTLMPEVPLEEQAEYRPVDDVRD